MASICAFENRSWLPVQVFSSVSQEYGLAACSPMHWKETRFVLSPFAAGPMMWISYSGSPFNQDSNDSTNSALVMYSPGVGGTT